MKDYYAEFIEKKSVNITETKVSKVSKGHFESKKETFDTFDTERSRINQKKSFLESLLLSNSILCEQFNFEVEERTAIMIFDDGLPESEAINLAHQTTFQVWLELFAGSI
ncbi:MAG TPA: hypothetical protein PKY82_01870 [Pyrinomonadaceae bacterium]|nr:hypothetical protein [Pyrinomonadaceae bacterium]